MHSYLVWGSRGKADLIRRDVDIAGILSERSYALQDPSRNIIAMCDATSTVAARFWFTPYGQWYQLTADFEPIDEESGIDWEFGFKTGLFGEPDYLVSLGNSNYNTALGLLTARERSFGLFRPNMYTAFSLAEIDKRIT